ncbi:FG-GAP-like repeat-containing protein [Nocardioides sp. zg-1228]|uniref:FG-GAP-like repeat-containing protein n=1 Tax=Nocardioides sp. zg-1228 TaxID=2763008 RepID=UPI0016426ED5|nr:FG-GAP-like repeat-containing protein [Nocardioides sp. zg-1228]MBC2933843.1 VCBS repeat-containing protein [Nocardioides sp. zg-1228]QSF58613.1 VCBS repeat-containing protein [Nocardioides sp. zg-1228]
MRPLQSRLVTLCQQVLALGVVLVVLTPASGVVSLDIVGEAPGAPSASAAPAALMSATVPTKAVTPTVTEVPLTGESGGFAGLRGRSVAGGATQARVVSTPQPVDAFGAVGVTWGAGEVLEEDQITLRVRTRTGEEWSDWEDLEYHDEHGPDPGSAEAAGARPGTEPTFVGDVDDVQVEARTDGVALPDDLSLALVDPGSATRTETEAPAETASDDPSASYDEEYAAQDGSTPTTDGLALQSATVASRQQTVAQPTIYSRAQWGADESIRNKKSLRYGSINGGFVHHTVNANNYTEAQVPALLRSIYAYHVKSRGWSDIGYNFLVDRFGRIWEGRYGGIDRPVVGAHTLNYNDYSFAMSAIGNFDVVQPPDVMLRAYGQLFAWKLSLHGVNPASTAQTIGRGTFPAISGHRDAGSTACPGKYLYAQLPLIRTYASQAAPVVTTPTELAISEPAPQNNLDASPYPDLVVRRASDGRGLVLPTGGLTSFQKRIVVGKRGWDKRADVLVSPDLTGDGLPDLVTADKSGVVRIRAGKGNGNFGKTTRKMRLRNYSLLTAVGDINGDGRNDLAARFKGRLVTLLATSKGGFARKVTRKGYGDYRQLIGAGDVNGDGRADLLVRKKNRLFLQTGYGTGRFAAPRRVAGAWSGYNRIVAGDFNGDGRTDLVARSSKGTMMLKPGRGDGTFGAALGPATNLKSMRWITGVNLVGGAGADLIGVSGKQLVVVANRDTFELGSPIDTGVSFAGMDRILNAGDVNRDGFGDVLTRDVSGRLWLFAGNGTGALAQGQVLAEGWGGIEGLTAVGDVTGDGLPDLVGTPAGGPPTVWPGNGSSFNAGVPIKGGAVPSRAGLPSDLSGFDWVLEVQAMTLKGSADYVVRDRASGVAYVYSGRKKGVSDPRVLGEGLGAFDLAG